MERDSESKKKALSSYRRNIGYDEEKIRNIALGSESRAVKESVSYLGFLNYHQSKNLYIEIYEDICFFAINIGRDRIRLIEIAVAKQKQGEGLGTEMLNRIKTIARKAGKKEITLRTSTAETACEFYQKNGGEVVGIKGGDYEIRIPIIQCKK